MKIIHPGVTKYFYYGIWQVWQYPLNMGYKFMAHNKQHQHIRNLRLYCISYSGRLHRMCVFCERIDFSKYKLTNTEVKRPSRPYTEKEEE